jgi:hypothetical protein
VNGGFAPWDNYKIWNSYLVYNPLSVGKCQVYKVEADLHPTTTTNAQQGKTMKFKAQFYATQTTGTLQT